MESKYLELSAPFEELQQRMEADLRQTGFAPKTKPPSSEPELPERLSQMADNEVKDIYDKTLRFYGYLCDQIARYEPFLVTTKKRLVVIEAEALQEAYDKGTLKNAELRRAHVDRHPAVKSALYDYLYFKQMNAVQEERRKKLSKNIERIYRELAFRHSQRIGLPKNADNSHEENRRTKLERLFIKRDDE